MPSNSEIRGLFFAAVITHRIAQSTAYRYRRWIRKFIEFHDGIALDQADDQDIIEYLASLSKLSGSTQHQAKNALDFLFKKVLKRAPLPSTVPPHRFFRPRKRYKWKFWR